MDLEKNTVDFLLQEITKDSLLIDKGIQQENILEDEHFIKDFKVVLLRIVENLMTLVYFEEFKRIKEFKNIEDYVKSREDLLFLSRFYKNLQSFECYSKMPLENERKAIYVFRESLYDCRAFVKNEYEIDILENLDDLGEEDYNDLSEYYKKIVEEIEKREVVEIKEKPTNRYYIHKKKTLYLNGKKYYELTLTVADEKSSKFDNVIVFTKINIPSFYAFHPKLEFANIVVLGREMSMTIVTGFKVSIRPCELVNYFKLYGYNIKVTTTDKDYEKLMDYLTKTGINLTELIKLDEKSFEDKVNRLTTGLNNTKIFDGLRELRKYKNKEGYNVLLYLLYRLRRSVIVSQSKEQQAKNYDVSETNGLFDLYLTIKCKGFDRMPFAYEPKKHLAKLKDVFAAIDFRGREHELLARKIKRNAENNAKMYTPIAELESFENVNNLIKRYNDKLCDRHKEDGKLVLEDGYVFIKGYERKTSEIISELIRKANTTEPGYKTKVKKWLNTYKNQKDFSDEKKEAILNLFNSSKVALIYGSAGTGKSTMIKHISNLYSNEKKIYLTHTHSANENLKRYVKQDEFAIFSTIKRFTMSNTDYGSCKVLIIDECSIVSNDDMLKVLNKAKFDLLVLVGDICQIESINFGNWFYVAKKYVPSNARVELSYVHRSADSNLKELWDGIRNLDFNDNVISLLDNTFSAELDDSIFNKESEDEIVLCLNYDGLYGINNINKFLQDSNPNKCVTLGVNKYKVGDKIVFKENKRFEGLLYNNLKGKIIGIDVVRDGKAIKFTLEVDKVFDKKGDYPGGLLVKNNNKNGKSEISFNVNEFKNSDDADKEEVHIVPFQIAYAISIHKSQGLEYDSVKIVITDEVEELISHNVFYTAITRAKSKLKIYWTKSAKEYIINGMKLRFNDEDAKILAKKFNYKLFD